MIKTFFEDILPSIVGKSLVVLAIVGTAGTSAYAGVKLFSTNPANSSAAIAEKREVLGDQIEKENETIPETTPQPTNTPRPTATPTPKVTPKASPTPTAMPLAKVTPKPTPASTNTGCIVTISGIEYNVSSLMTTHSGGNIFKCGTDMTTSYQGKHGTNMSRMSKYLVSNIGTGGSITTGNTNTGGSDDGHKDEDEEESEREKERYVEKHDEKDEEDEIERH